MDAGFAVGVDCWVAEAERAADLGEDGGAAGGDAVLLVEVTEVAEGEVDTLVSLEDQGLFEEDGGKIQLGGLVFGKLGVKGAERCFCPSQSAGSACAAGEPQLATGVCSYGDGLLGVSVYDRPRWLSGGR